MLADLSPEDLGWIAEHSDRVTLEPGEIFIRPGERAESMFIGLEGTLQARQEQLGPGAPVFVFRAGDIGGTIPFSRMTTFSAVGRAVTRAVIVRFPRSLFPDLLRRIPVLEARMVSHLIDRVRDATRREAQFEKLTALGKLSAGLAHELNNPAAAVLRTMGDAQKRLDERGEITAALVTSGVSPESIRRLDDLRRAASHLLEDGSKGGPVSGENLAADALDRSDRGELLAAWLRDTFDFPDPWGSAAVFVDAGIDRGALEDVLQQIPVGARRDTLRWLHGGLVAQALHFEAAAATRRITQLLDALKAYTNRDRMREMVDVDIRDGIESTITLFGGRARKKGVTVERALDPVPRIRAYPGDLNQVWANLLDNAIDAVPAGTGKVSVRTRVEDGNLVAEVADNGPGIPPELQERVFEPFFTTKDVGAGAGLGLDVARRVVADLHGGALTMSSVPGDTRFAAHLPLTTVGTFGS
jgi:signal transduction histidine kinase